MLMRSMSTIDQQILYHATKLSHVDGLCTTLKEDNLSEESQLTHEIDCVNVNPIMTACWQTTGKTDGPTFFTAGSTTVAVTCFRSRIENNPSNQSLEGWLCNPAIAQPSKKQKKSKLNMKKQQWMNKKKIENRKQRKQKSQNERNRNPRVYIF